MSRFAQGYGRVPTFDESMAFRNELEERVSNYLVAHPEVTVEVGGETFQARASVTQGEEHTRLFDQMAAEMPGFAEYQRRMATWLGLYFNCACADAAMAAVHNVSTNKNRFIWVFLLS